MKMGKCSFKRGIIALHFGEKYSSLHLPFSETMVDPLGVLTGLLLAAEYHTIAAL